MAGNPWWIISWRDRPIGLVKARAQDVRPGRVVDTLCPPGDQELLDRECREWEAAGVVEAHLGVVDLEHHDEVVGTSGAGMARVVGQMAHVERPCQRRRVLHGRAEPCQRCSTVAAARILAGPPQRLERVTQASVRVHASVAEEWQRAGIALDKEIAEGLRREALQEADVRHLAGVGPSAN